MQKLAHKKKNTQVRFKTTNLILQLKGGTTFLIKTYTCTSIQYNDTSTLNKYRKYIVLYCVIIFFLMKIMEAKAQTKKKIQWTREENSHFQILKTKKERK